MYRFSLTLGRQLPKATMVLAGPNQSPFRLPPSVEIKERSFSTKANDLSKVIPEFWIRKMKTAFRYRDINGDGKLTEKDVAAWANELGKLFPEWSEEQKKDWEAKQNHMWNEIAGGRGKTEGSGYVVTENMFIENIFLMVSAEGAEARYREAFGEVFELMDLDRDGKVSKKEHRRLREAAKNVDPNFDLNAAIVSFSAIDRDNDGIITRDEYVEAAMEFFYNFADETKPSKHFFGPLVKE